MPSKCKGPSLIFGITKPPELCQVWSPGCNPPPKHDGVIGISMERSAWEVNIVLFSETDNIDRLRSLLCNESHHPIMCSLNIGVLVQNFQGQLITRVTWKLKGECSS